MRFARLFAVALPLLLACGGAQTVPGGAAVTADQTPAQPSIVVTPDMGSPHPGEAAPDFEAADQDGNKVKLSSTRGSVVVLAFVTSWCPFSEAEQPHLAKLAEDYKEKNVRFLAVALKENDANYKKYMDRVKMPFPVLHDPDGAVGKLYTPANAQPEVKDRSSVIVSSTLVLDRAGKIQFFTMVDTARFDAKLVHVRRKVDELLGAGGS
jgi:peroxiredoxin